MGLHEVKFSNISQTSPVQKRISLARAAIYSLPDKNCFAIPGNLTARKIAHRFPSDIRDGSCAYFCFGGDISLLVNGFGFRDAIGYDCRPMFNPRIDDEIGHQPTKAFDDTLEEFLAAAARERMKCGFLYNGFLSRFNEVASFMFFDILALGGTDLKVFQTESGDQLYKITFDLHQQRFRVYVVRETLIKGNRPSHLEEVEPFTVLIRAGDSGFSDPYAAIGHFSGSLPAGSLLVSDKEITSPQLKPVYFPVQPAPFGYSASNVYIYRK